MTKKRTALKQRENNWKLSNIQEKKDYSKWMQAREEDKFLMPLLLLSQLDF